MEQFDGQTSRVRKMFTSEHSSTHKKVTSWRYKMVIKRKKQISKWIKVATGIESLIAKSPFSVALATSQSQFEMLLSFWFVI